jgi:hypothetical protein
VRCFDHRRQFLLGLFGSAMMTMVQRLDAGSFFLDPLLSVFNLSCARPQGMPESF